MNRVGASKSRDIGEAGPTGLAIEVKGLSKSFGRTSVLRDLDFEARWGEALTVLGPNGSGKTTLIKTLATLTKPDAGTIRVAGLDVARSGQRVRGVIGVLTHDTMLYDQLTGYENLKFFARMFNLDRIDERVTHAAERLGMSSRLRQRVGTMSHGMRKRFTIARALLHDPAILLMDEPESGLDQEALAILEEIIADETAPHRTVVMTTHNLERGLALGQRAAILSRGRIVYQGSLECVGADALREQYFRHTGAPVC